MAQKERWFERQQRMVRCSRHGLHYDPAKARGCYLCQKEAAKRRRPTPPRFLVLLLATLGMAIVLFRIVGPSFNSASGSAADTAATTSEDTTSTFDAERYRTSLTDFERILFDPAVQTREDLEILSGRLQTAAAGIRSSLEEHDGEAVVTRAFAELADSIPRQLDFQELERLRGRWVRLRKRHLPSVAWLTAEIGSDEPANRRAAEAQYLSITSGLVQLLDEALAEAESHSGGNADRGDWQTYLSDWGGRLQGLADGDLRRPRTDSPSNILVGFDLMSRAFDQALAVRGGGSPTADIPRLQQARDLAERARQSLDQ